MVNGIYKSQAIEGKYAISVMLMLLDKGSMSKGILSHALSSGSGVVQDRVKELKEVDLLTEKKEDRRPFRIMVELTPRGRAVAEKLREIEEILSGT